MVKRVLWITLICAIFAVSPAAAVTFTPSDIDIFDLDHYRWYSWRINWTPSAGERITGATLTMYDVFNSVRENNDQLNIWLLDDPVLGNVRPDIYQGTDGQAISDFFATYSGAGDRAKVATYTDPDDYLSRSTLTYDLFRLGLGDELSVFASDAYFGFGFDPDCHYGNSRIQLDVTTSSVPEPSTLLLLGVGLVGLVSLRKRGAI